MNSPVNKALINIGRFVSLKKDHVATLVLTNEYTIMGVTKKCDLCKV